MRDADVIAALANRARTERLHLPEAARGLVVVSDDGVIRRTLDDMGFATFGLEPEPTAATIAAALRNLQTLPGTARLPCGLFGVGRAGDDILRAAADCPHVLAVVVAGGLPDESLVRDGVPPLLLIAGGEDRDVLRAARADGRYEVAVVAGAAREFSEPGAMEQVAHLGATWLATRLARG